jgi:hypothetical protein
MQLGHKRKKGFSMSYFSQGSIVARHISREEIQPAPICGVSISIKILSSENPTSQWRVGKQSNVAVIRMANFNKINCG